MAKIKGKSICVFSGKGGVGKSSITLCLAGIFASLNKKVLIIDFDTTGGAIATYLNKIPEKSVYNFVDDYANNRYQSINSYVTKYNDSISFLSSCKDPRQGSKIDSSYIELVIEKSIYEYDIVLIDTSHVLSEFNVTLLDKVDNILLLCTNDLFDLKNMRNIVKIFNDANIKKYNIMLNNSVFPEKKYYSLYDIKSIINANIDYIIPSDFHFATYDNYVADGKIITLDKRFSKCYPKTSNAFFAYAKEIEEVTNEK